MDLREQIMAANDFDTVAVEVWGCTVHLKSLSAKQVLEWDKLDTRTLIKSVILSLCDADGKKLFNDDDVPVLMDKSYNTIGIMMKVFNKLNGFDKEDAKKN